MQCEFSLRPRVPSRTLSAVRGKGRVVVELHGSTLLVKVNIFRFDEYVAMLALRFYCYLTFCLSSLDRSFPSNVFSVPCAFLGYSRFHFIFNIKLDLNGQSCLFPYSLTNHWHSYVWMGCFSRILVYTLHFYTNIDCASSKVSPVLNTFPVSSFAIWDWIKYWAERFWVTMVIYLRCLVRLSPFVSIIGPWLLWCVELNLMHKVDPYCWDYNETS